MTEKQYGGQTNYGSRGKTIRPADQNINFSADKENKTEIEKMKLKHEDLMSLKEAGKIAKDTRDYAKTLIKPGMKLLEIAEKIEDKIMSSGGKPAFPVNLCINELAAHYTPSHDDENTAEGLLKVDIGVHVNGFIADTAFSLDLENSEENEKLIKASQEAVSSALKVVKKGIETGTVGAEIHRVISQSGFSPIRNLTGHEVTKWFLHSGVSIPNYNNSNKTKIEEGVYAIEPFVTTGQGIVYESKPSGIYCLKDKKPVRDTLAREIQNFIFEEYKTLPFCSRWIVKKFAARSLNALRMLEQAGSLQQFSQLVEKGKEKVAQSEHTIVVFDDKTEVTTD